jgi:hypothetical protein
VSDDRVGVVADAWFADGDAVLSEADVVAAFVRDDDARDELSALVSRAVVLDDVVGGLGLVAEMDRRVELDEDDDTAGDCAASSNDGNVVQSGRVDRDDRAVPVDDSPAEVVWFDDSRVVAGAESDRFDGAGRSR